MAGPRFSIIPGEFAADPRADVGHFRVLNMIGRHTDKHGWCRVKQLTIADEIGLTRETVNRKIRDLVEWGYVDKQAVDRTGRAIAYRTILDRPPLLVASDLADDGDDGDGDADAAPDTADASANPAAHSSPGPVRDGSHVGYNQDAALYPTCDRTDHSSCDRTRAQQERLSNDSKTPLPPQAGDSAGLALPEGEEAKTAAAKAQAALAKVRRTLPVTTVLDAVIAPLLEQRRFSATDHAAAFREIAAAAATLPVAHLGKVLEIVLAADVQTLKAQRVLDAIEAVRKGGLMLVVANGAPEFAAWLRYWEKTNPAIARMISRADKWQFPDRFPPTTSQTEAA